MERTHVVQVAADESEPLLREQEAAEILTVSFRTLQAWRVRGGGPRFWKIGHAVRYRRSDLIAWVAVRGRTNTIELERAS